MIDLNDYKQVRTWAHQLHAEDDRRRADLLKAADHINTTLDGLKSAGKMSANNTERARIELFGALVHGADIPESYLV